MGKFTLADLEKRVHERAQASASESYTRTLLDKGVDHCAKKLGEEAIETVLEAISAAGYKTGSQITIAMDAANSELWDAKKKKYVFHKSSGKEMSSEQLV